MRRTLTVLATTLVVAAGISSTASAATLYTTAAHTTPAAVGTYLSLANPPGVYYLIYHGAPGAGGAFFDGCVTNYLALQVTQNSGGVFKANVVERSLNTCSIGWLPKTAGMLQISGSSTTVGANKSWAATTLTGSMTYGSTYTESFSGAGVSAQQPTAGGSPVSVVLNHAGTMTSSAGPVYNVSGTYQFSGAYSLG
jgi:hypothetical protein